MKDIRIFIALSKYLLLRRNHLSFFVLEKENEIEEEPQGGKGYKFAVPNGGDYGLRRGC